MSAIVADPRTQTQILGLKRASEQEFASIWQEMVRGIAKDIKSKDFGVRHATRVHFLRVLTAGDPPLHRIGDMGGAAGDVTLEELVATLAHLRDTA